MKRILFTLTLLITLSSFGQKQEATLFFKNGAILEGFAHFGSFNSKISYKKTKESNKLYFDTNTIDRIIVHEKKEDIEYQYKRIKGRKNYRFYRPTLKGKVTLFVTTTKPVDPSQVPVTYFYASKGVNGELEKIGSTLWYSNFKKSASKYFKDCPKLVKKIESKKFRRRDIEDIVNFYNKNCGE
ncbi:MAG: hypothetical protein L3J14_08675 [Flavobacteriaceae bacterium]|nr:hypothetical protein [Flavobacteriaceae bacterium]